MSITTLDGLVAAARQKVPLNKTTVRTSVAAVWFSMFDVAGQPGAGTLNVGNTANGLVPTDAVAGFPILNAFGGSAVGYLASLAYSCTVAARLMLFDRLFHAGAYVFNANTTLSAQPSFAARIPDANYAGTEIWIEAVTAFTGNLSVAVTYTNQAGTTGRTTGTVATGAALIVGRMLMLPLQAGDSGVQKIESVVATVATAGTFNVLVLRPLWFGRVIVANSGDVHGFDRTGMPVVFADSALFPAIAADSTSTGLPEFLIEVVNG